MNNLKGGKTVKKTNIYTGSILDVCQRKLFEQLYLESSKDIESLAQKITLKVKDVNICSITINDNITYNVSYSDILEEAGEHLSRIILNILLTYAQKTHTQISNRRLQIENGV